MFEETVQVLPTDAYREAQGRKPAGVDQAVDRVQRQAQVRRRILRTDHSLPATTTRRGIGRGLGIRWCIAASGHAGSFSQVIRKPGGFRVGRMERHGKTTMFDSWEDRRFIWTTSVSGRAAGFRTGVV
jgi:hypothetical protein